VSKEWAAKRPIIKKALFVLSLCFWFSAQAEFADQSAEAIVARIAPIGKVNIASASGKKQAFFSEINDHLGKTIFENRCILCHASGIAGAPRFGISSDWKTRIHKKLSLLLQHVITGYRAMPPKGACLECSTADLEAAINYMMQNISPINSPPANNQR
jgi:cytochrome c5